MTSNHIAAVRSRVNSGHSGQQVSSPTRSVAVFSCKGVSESAQLRADEIYVVSPSWRAELVDGIPPTKPTYRRKTTNDVNTSVSDERCSGKAPETRLAPKRRSAHQGCFSGQRRAGRCAINPSAPVHKPLLRKNAVPVRTGRTARRSSENRIWSGRAAGQVAMQIPWMTRDELSQAIPPAYTEWIGKHLIRAIVSPARRCH